MLGGGEFSVNCLHGEQMFNNRLLRWADYDIMHLRLNKSRLEIQHNLVVRVNDHWNNFTKACGMWVVTSTFSSPDNNFHPWKMLSFKQELIWKSPLSSAVHEVSHAKHPSQVWPVIQVMSKCLLHHGYPGRLAWFFAAEFSGSCDSSLACGCCGLSLLPSSPALLLPLLCQMLLPISCPPSPIPCSPAPWNAVSCMSRTPSCGESQATENWDLAGAGWKTKCCDLLHKIMSSVTKKKRIKIPGCWRKMSTLAAAAHRCMYGACPALENIPGSLQIKASGQNVVLFSLYVFRHFPPLLGIVIYVLTALNG